MKELQPISPPWANRFLDWYCKSEVWEEVRGDLEESYSLDVEERSRLRASITYWLEVVLFIRSHTIRKRDPYQSQGSIMWKNYATVAVRSMKKQKSYSGINLVGLALGLACTFMIMKFVVNERSYDSYHQDADRIYRITADVSSEGFDGIAKINGAWGVAATAEIPAIESVARFTNFGDAQFQLGDRKEYVRGGYYADSTTFDVFSWKVLLGDATKALNQARAMVLTQSVATTWFGAEDPRGKNVVINGGEEFTVTAVMEDVPENSHFKFTFLTSYAGYTDARHDDWVAWNQYYTYVKVTPGVNVSEVDAALTKMVSSHMTEEQAAGFGDVGLQALTDIYLRSNMFREIAAMGNETAVNIFLMLALFILLLATVNFVNLSTARSALRAREVGVRKNLGARRLNLISQFLAESVFTVFIAAVLASGLVMAALSWFNQVSGKTFTILELFSASAILPILGILLTIGLVAGLYPAFVLSSFSPIRAIKGGMGTAGGAGLRKGLVVLQFAVSATLIMGTGVVATQLNYIKNKPLGFEKANIVGVPFRDPALLPVRQAIRDEMALVPGVEHIALSANRPGGGDYGIPVEIPGLSVEEVPSIRMLVADYDYLDVYQIEVASGRAFDVTQAGDEASGIMINEELARQLKWSEPVGMKILMPAIDREFEVIGVMKDFHFRSLHESISPLILFMAPDVWYSMLNIRLNPASIALTMPQLAAIYERYDVNNPFTYSFMDETLDDLYAADQRMEELLNVFTLLAIIIACLGLFGLASFTAERRKAEIGVRKVLGASESQIVGMLSRETALLVVISMIIAIPIVLYFGGDWLSSYAYSASISVFTLGFGCLLTIGLALFTTGTQALRAARLDPIKAIRTD